MYSFWLGLSLCFPHRLNFKTGMQSYIALMQLVIITLVAMTRFVPARYSIARGPVGMQCDVPFMVIGASTIGDVLAVTLTHRIICLDCCRCCHTLTYLLGAALIPSGRRPTLSLGSQPHIENKLRPFDPFTHHVIISADRRNKSTYPPTNIITG